MSETPLLPELALVTVQNDVRAEEGRLPAGSTGTVMHVYRGGQAYEVEFERPFHCVLTLERQLVSEASATP